MSDVAVIWWLYRAFESLRGDCELATCAVRTSILLSDRQHILTSPNFAMQSAQSMKRKKAKRTEHASFGYFGQATTALAGAS